MALDQDQLLLLVDRVYEASLEPESWPGVLQDLACLLGAVGSDYYLMRDGEIAFCSVHGLSQDAFELFLRDYYSFADRVRVATRMPEGGLTTDLDFLSPEEMARDPYYQEFLKGVGTQHCMLSVPFRRGNEQSVFAVHLPYGQGPPQQQDFQPIAKLMPHLRRAGQLQMRLAPAGLAGTATEAAINRIAAGILLLDRRGKVAAMNATAERILARDVGLRLDRGRLTARHRDQDALLRHAVDRALTPLVLDRVGEALTVTGARPGTAISVLISPLPSERSRREGFGAIVMLGEPSRSARDDAISYLQAAFGVTPAEARLALSFLETTSLPESASALSWTEASARQILKRVFHKTDTHGQAALVKVLLRRLPASLRMMAQSSD